MRVHKQPGTKERLFEMMANVNKSLLKEDFDFHGAEMDHLGQQDLAADQTQHPETHNNSPLSMDHPSQRDFDDKQQTSIKEDNGTQVLKFAPKYKYWDVSVYPYGGDLKAFDGSETGVFEKGYVKTGDQIRVKLSNGRIAVAPAAAVTNMSFDEVIEKARQFGINVA